MFIDQIVLFASYPPTMNQMLTAALDRPTTIRTTTPAARSNLRARRPSTQCPTYCRCSPPSSRTTSSI
uniref:Uncharacterized protein n=1 Tax=Panagrellus redivivus TaxID=6233 RepID=A0A7E4ZT68_PANRE